MNITNVIHIIIYYIDIMIDYDKHIYNVFFFPALVDQVYNAIENHTERNTYQSNRVHVFGTNFGEYMSIK